MVKLDFSPILFLIYIANQIWFDNNLLLYLWYSF